MVDEIKSALTRMKFASNHSYLFHSPGIAAVCGFLQAAMNFWIEGMNIIVLLTVFEPLNLIAQFVVLQIMANFDNYICDSLGNENGRKLLRDGIIE